jgi:hypothetical protein
MKDGQPSGFRIRITVVCMKPYLILRRPAGIIIGMPCAGNPYTRFERRHLKRAANCGAAPVKD